MKIECQYIQRKSNWWEFRKSHPLMKKSQQTASPVETYELMKTFLDSDFSQFMHHFFKTGTLSRFSSPFSNLKFSEKKFDFFFQNKFLPTWLQLHYGRFKFK